MTSKTKVKSYSIEHKVVRTYSGYGVGHLQTLLNQGWIVKFANAIAHTTADKGYIEYILEKDDSKLDIE